MEGIGGPPCGVEGLSGVLWPSVIHQEGTAVSLASRARRWFFRRRRGPVGRVRTLAPARGATRVQAAVAAYRAAVNWGERMSRFAHEAVEVPAYEARALRGERSPQRFRWRGRWYRVVEVIAFWQDGRKPAPGRAEYGRAYFNVATEPKGLFQIYYDRSAPDRKGNGRWMLYRKTEIRPGRM